MKGATVIDHDWRPDIQILRGLAVSLVILEHAAAGLIPGGFLGVDIFFVISGFLMTKLILTDLDAGSFSFGAFYARRARRLLPAAYTTILVTLVAAPALIDPHELRDLAFQAVGAFTFTTNLVLWRQTDYFGSGAGLKPLLHLWSLSLEEQYFLLLPALLVFTPGRLRIAAVAGAVAVSMVLCLWFIQRSPSAAFYFLPFRAWELGFGSLAALSMRAGWHLPLNRTLVTAAAAILLLVPCLAGQGGHPGWPAFVVCTATVVILLTRGVPTYRALASLGLVGDRSYSLYLVHWPVFAFANNIWLTPLPSTVAALLLVICLVAAEAQYRWVEIPFRRASVTRQMIAAFVAIPLATLGITLAWVKPASAPEIANRAANPRLEISTWPPLAATARKVRRPSFGATRLRCTSLMDW
jgi:peptidoglycan/LPS O-acetylase OafA/YrhL